MSKSLSSSIHRIYNNSWYLTLLIQIPLQPFQCNLQDFQGQLQNNLQQLIFHLNYEFNQYYVNWSSKIPHHKLYQIVKEDKSQERKALIYTLWGNKSVQTQNY